MVENSVSCGLGKTSGILYSLHFHASPLKVLKTLNHEMCSRNSHRKDCVDQEDIKNLYLENLT